MKLKVLFFIPLILLVHSSLSAQLGKGLWWVDGDLDITNTVQDQSSTSIAIVSKLGGFVHDKILLGGTLEIGLRDKRSVVENQLFVRYYFKELLDKYYFFGSLAWERWESTPMEAGKGYLRFERQSGFLGLGLDQVLNPNVVLEYFYNYNFFESFKSKDFTERRTGGMYFGIGLKVFFNGKLKAKAPYEALRPGRWMLSRDLMNVQGVENRGTFWTQVINPEVGYTIRKNWMLGAKFDYRSGNEFNLIFLGLNPFTRYYLSLSQRRKLFAGAGLGYNIFLLRSDGRYVNIHEPKAFAHIGFSTFITEFVSFDIRYNYEYTRQLAAREFRSENPNRITNGFSIGLQCFL